ncbi:MAG TPA: enoyl-CoA hydratase/isomerase family protein [Streptosporangiaceae bacterium]|nr:enoyl-CoA hydratase/isomerase family protein [Streptosporangiaceae bacterium]
MTFGDVTASVSSFVGTAEINRPPNNFFDAELIRSLAECYRWLEAKGARAIVLASAGKNFCAGADFTGRSAAGRVNSGGGAGELYQQALRLFEAPLPVVAAVQGAAVGGGLGLACAADFRVASPQSRFSANFAMIGLHHGFGLTVTLPAIVGQQRATELLYTGKRINGEDAQLIGLADRLVDAEELRPTAHDLAAEIASAAPLAVRAIRATMRDGLADRIKAATDRELAEQQKLWPTADFAEGVKAAAERRSPKFESK